MLEVLPEDIRKGLEAAQARAARTGSRLCVHVADGVYPVLELSDTGFRVDLARTPRLRGLVDLYDGPRHISRALIIAAEEDAGAMVYEFKRETPITGRPIRDYVEDRPQPAGYLPNQR